MEELSSNISTPKHAELSTPVLAVALPLFGLVAVLSFLANCLVIIAFKKFAKLHTITNFFIVSLAGSDLLISTISVPLWMHKMTQMYHPTSHSLYKIWIFSDIVGGAASIFNLSLISYERYLCISIPLGPHLTKKMAKFYISAVWLLALVLAILQRVMTDHITIQVNEIYLSFSCFFLPLIFICFNYLRIFKLARKQLYKINNSGPRGTGKILLKELKAAKTIAVIIGVFIICWTPFFVFNLLWGFCACWVNLSMDIVVFVKLLHYFNSVLNPIIYTWRSQDFREAFLKLIEKVGKTRAKWTEVAGSEKEYCNAVNQKSHKKKCCAVGQLGNGHAETFV